MQRRREFITAIGSIVAVGACSNTASAETTSGTIEVNVGRFRNPISYEIELNNRRIDNRAGQGETKTHSVSDDALVERVTVESSGGAWLLQHATFSFFTDPHISETRFELKGSGGEGYRVGYSDSVVNDSVDNLEKVIDKDRTFSGYVNGSNDSDTLLGRGALRGLECTFNHGTLVYDRL